MPKEFDKAEVRNLAFGLRGHFLCVVWPFGEIGVGPDCLVKPCCGSLLLVSAHKRSFNLQTRQSGRRGC
jgi:hypothetical protein